MEKVCLVSLGHAASSSLPALLKNHASMEDTEGTKSPQLLRCLTF